MGGGSVAVTLFLLLRIGAKGLKTVDVDLGDLTHSSMWIRDQKLRVLLFYQLLISFRLPSRVAIFSSTADGH